MPKTIRNMATDRERTEFELRDYLGVLRRRKVTILVVALVAVGVALVASWAQTAVYEARAEVLLQQRASEQISIFTPDGVTVNDAERLVDTEIRVLESRTIRDAVREEAGHSVDASISAVGDTDVIAIEVESTDPGRAADDANAYAAAYIETRRRQTVEAYLAAGQEVQAQIDEIEGQLATLDPAATAERARLESQRGFYEQQLDQLQVAGNIAGSGGALLVTTASVPDAPIRPTPLRNAVLALALGLVAGVGLAFLREYLDDTVKTKSDLERASGLTVAALIPTMPGWRKRSVARVVTLSDPNSRVAEAYRTLRTSVQFLGLERPIRTLQVTSPNAEEGKTTTVANLGVVLAQAGLRVVVVCCDLRRPRIHEFFGLSNSVGLTSVLLGQTTVSAAVQGVAGVDNLALLAAGPPPPNPSELLSSKRAVDALATLASNTDLVLIDSPPVLPVTDAIVLSRVVDAMLVAASAGATTKRNLHRAVEVLQQVDAPLLGTVLNQVRDEGEGYGYEYQYGSTESSRRKGRRAGRTNAREVPEAVVGWPR